MLNAAQVSPISNEARVQALAYALWLEEGCPDGRAEAHWFQAVELANAEVIAPAVAAKPKKVAAAAAKKPAARKKAAK